VRNISEKDLSVVIPLLFIKIREMTEELNAIEAVGNELSTVQFEECHELRDCLEEYTNILDRLHQEYDCGLAEGTNLPTYEELTRFPT
jgi:hypothetical protein